MTLTPPAPRMIHHAAHFQRFPAPHPRQPCRNLAGRRVWRQTLFKPSFRILYATQDFATAPAEAVLPDRFIGRTRRYIGQATVAARGIALTLSVGDHRPRAVNSVEARVTPTLCRWPRRGEDR